MATAKLSVSDQSELKQLVLIGTTPEDLSERFQVSVSTIHNYKTILRKAGLKIPDVRGRRPHHRFLTPATLPVQEQTDALSTVSSGEPEGTPVFAGVDGQVLQPTHVQLRVNGLRLSVDTRASQITVDESGIAIDF